MSATETGQAQKDEQGAERTWNEAASTTDWTPFPVGYGILLNERYQFPMDMALARMRLDATRQLFVDDHVIAHMQGVTRETHSTREHPANPVFAPYKHYPSHICPDPEHGFRLYYNSGGWALHVAYSRDGVNWEMPELNVFDDFDSSSFPGGPNNVVAVGELHGLFFEPEEPDPERRWKAILRRSRQPHRHKPWPYLRVPSEGKVLTSPSRLGRPYELHVSPDGYRWTFEAETNHWHGPNATFVAPNDLPTGFGDVFTARWDPKLGKYIGNTKHVIGPDYRMTPVIGGGRAVGQRESDDLVHWTAPRIYAYPDGEDAKQPLNGMQGVYEADGYPYESMWFNNLSMSTLTPASKEQIRQKALVQPYIKRNWIRQAASRDGRHWYYFGDRKPFIPLGPEGSWKPGYLRMANLVTTGGPIVNNDELWYYYRGMRNDGPKSTYASSTGIALLRRDGFASLNADDDGGLVITRPLVFEGEGKLHVNAEVSAGGYVRASVVDEDTAEELGSFTEEESAAVAEDTTRAPLRWRERESLGQLKDHYVRLAFHLKSAKLYSFWIE